MDNAAPADYDWGKPSRRGENDMAREPRLDRLRPPRPSGGAQVALGIAAAAALVLIVGLLMTGFVVTAGHVGVVTTFGMVDEGVLYPGFHLRVPFVNQIHQIDVRVQPHPFKQIDAASLEQQSVKWA